MTEGSIGPKTRREYPMTEEEYKRVKTELARRKKNAMRRARHQVMTDLGMKRVKGALGGVYYE